MQKKLTRSTIGASLLALAMSFSTGAHAAPASEASVESLLVATRARDAVDISLAGIEKPIRRGMEAALGGQPPNAAQQRLLDEVPARLATVLRSTFGWDALKPGIVKLYVDNFSQDEVDAAIAFYSSPVGVSMVSKMPQVVEQTLMMSMQASAKAMPQLQSEMKSLAEQIKNAR